MAFYIDRYGNKIEIGAATGGIDLYDSDKDYTKGDVVIYNDVVYTANTDSLASDRSAGDRFNVTGADSDTFRPLSIAGVMEYDSDAAYAAGQLVLRENKLYRSVSDRVKRAENEFRVGTDSDSFRPVGDSWYTGESGQVQGVAGASGDPNGSNYFVAHPANTWVDTLSFQVETSGKYHASFEALAPQAAPDTNRWVGFSINGAAPTAAASQIVSWNHTSSGYYQEHPVYISRILTLSAGDVVTVQIMKTAGSSTGDYGIYCQASGGVPSLTWNKVSDFVPAIGLKSEYMFATATVSTTLSPASTSSPIRIYDWAVSTSQGISFDGQKFGPLKAGVTYELNANIGISTAAEGSNASEITCAWLKAGTTTKIGSSGIHASSGLNYTSDGANNAYAIYTPSVDEYVEIACIGNTAGADMDERSSRVSIQAIANHAPIYKDYEPEYGEKELPATIDIAATGGAGQKQLFTFDIPSAGTWEIITVARGGQTFNQDVSTYIKRADGTTVEASKVMIGNGGVTSQQSSGTTSVVLTTSAAETMSFWANSVSTTGYIFSDTNGRTKVTWNKIAGRLPMTNADTLGGLGDVDTSSAVSGSMLEFNGSSWLPTPDTSGSGYLDIGNVRIQWGTEPTGTEYAVVNFTAPFADANYSINYNFVASSPSIIQYGKHYNATTTNVTVRRQYYAANNGSYGAASEAFTWIAIGLKP